MSVGYLLLLAALLGFSTLGIFHKVADHPECRAKNIAVLLLFWAGVLTTTYTFFFAPKGLHFPREVLLIGALGGVFSSLALFAFQAGLKFGKISTSWLVINLSMSVPILLSIFSFGEKLNATKAVGITLVIAAIILLWRDKKIDLAKSLTEKTNLPGAQKSKWLLLMVLAFMANGVSASTSKLLGEAGFGDYAWQFVTVLYWAGFGLMMILNLVNGSRPNRREFGIALVMAVGSVIGNVCLTKALDVKMPGHVDGSIGYPIGNGGSLTLVVLAGVLFFKEKIHPIGIAGIVCGLTAILILIMG